MKKEKVFVLIDGSNFYYKLKSLKISKTSKYDYRGLVNYLVGKRNCIECVYYIGTVRTKKNNTKSLELRSQQQKLFNHLTSKTQNIRIEKGFLMENRGKFHEKGVDVKIAVDLLIGAYENTYDTALLISSDTDLIPAIRKVREKKKNIEYIGFSHAPSLGLQKYATLSRLLIKEDIIKFAFK